MPASRDFSKYVGIPFKEHGRTPEGFDCWGLVRYVLEQEYGCLLPSYTDEYTELEKGWLSDLVSSAVRHINPIQVAVPEEGCVVSISYRGFPCHVGLYVGGGFVLHSDIVGKGESKLERVTSPHLAPRIVAYYRVLQDSAEHNGIV